MNSLLELLNEHGYKVVWADDQIDHDDIDDEMSIKDYLTDLGIKTNN
jgi:glucan phosphoethanolaminetransferase (alkaline phosphatase superfamily)